MCATPKNIQEAKIFMLTPHFTPSFNKVMQSKIPPPPPPKPPDQHKISVIQGGYHSRYITRRPPNNQ